MATPHLWEILRLLEQNARLTPEQVATMTGRPLEEVKAAIRAAEEQRQILRYKALVDWERAGEERVEALIEVKVAPERGVGFDAVAARIARYPEVRAVFLVSGTYDLAVTVVGKTMKEVAAFVAEKLAPLDQVQGTVTHFLLKRYKEDGELFVAPEEVERQPFAP